MARIISLTILITLIAVLGVTFFQVIAPFLLPLFLAAVVSILSQPLYRTLICKTGGRRHVAAGLTTVALLLMVLVPLLVGTLIAAAQLFTLAQDTLGSQNWRDTARSVRNRLAIDQIAAQLAPYVYGVSPPEEIVDVEVSAAPGAPENTGAAADEAIRSPGESAVDGGAGSNEAAMARHRERVDRLQEQLAAYLRTGLRAISERTLGVAGAAAGAVPGFVGSLVSGLVGAIMFVIALYYFLADGPAMISAAERLVPVSAAYQRELLAQFESVVRAIVLATFLAALGQGLVTAGAIVLCGFGHFFIFFILATLMSLVPLVGAWIVWGPCAFWLAYQGHWGSCVFLVVVGTGVVGTMDNVIRTFVLQSDAKLHPLLAFVSVLGGLQAMGLWGVFVGPIVASCLHALVQIFNTELKEFSRMKFGGVLEVEDVDTDSELRESQSNDAQSLPVSPSRDNEANVPKAASATRRKQRHHPATARESKASSRKKK